MKKIKYILITLSVVFVFGCRVTVIDAEKLSERDGLYYEEGKTVPYTGKATNSFSNGKKQMEIRFANGIPHGNWSTWLENGNLTRGFEYKNGELIRFTVYCLNGDKLLFAEYKNGKEHGKNILWFKNGGKKFDVDFRNGKKHGIERHWHENGQLAFEAEYIRGKKIKATYWDKKGRVKSKQ